MYVDIRGLLLIAANGDMYFIEGGIKANKITSYNPDNLNFPEGVQSLEPYRLKDAPVRAFEDEQRKGLKLPPRTYPAPDEKPDPNKQANLNENLGPIVMHAYNVVVRREEDGTSMITGNTTNFDVSRVSPG
jgi:hypothetical protein